MSRREKRKQIRFDAEENSLAHIIYEENTQKRYKVGLLHDESFSGCSVILSGDLQLKEKDRLVIKPGLLDKRLGEVCWVKRLEPKIIKIGVLYID
ncbi:MAG: hypothetical protein HQK77_02005 [Desulfobacterales bacterium]|nr:hypothetical protein [Desulfobacterales bacterium]